MAFVDESGKIVVRVVYDGPALAGKTSNVRRLSEAFRARAQSEVISVEQKGDRTRFLDWLQVDTGLVAGRHLSSHFISVPGQRVLVRRREVLLRLADSVVFVCSAEPEALEENVSCYESLLQVLKTRGETIPVLLQLNKVDHPRALEERVIRKALRLDDGARLSSAIASEGEGVRETAVLALRAAADRVQNAIVKDGLESISDPPGDAYALALLMKEEERRDQRSLVEVVLDARPLALTSDGPKRAEVAVIRSGLRLPHAELASGMIWPANDGRDLLRRAAHQEPEELQNAPGGTNAFEAGMWMFRTDGDGFDNVDEAKEGLLLAVRKTLQLGTLAIPQLVLCLTEGLDRKFYLWRVEPMMATLKEQLDYGFAQGCAEHVERHLRAYLRGVARVAGVAQEGEATFRLAPERFSLVGERLYFLDHQVEDGLPDFEEQVIRVLTSLGLTDDAWSWVRDEMMESFSPNLWDMVLERRGRASRAAPRASVSVAAS